MLNRSRLIAFVATTDPDRAKAFYENTLGLTCISDEPSAFVFDANGTMLRVSKVQELIPAGYTVLGWSVADIKAEMKELAKRGVIFERFEGLPQDEEGICTFQDGTMVAWFKDPDKNVLSLTQFS